MRQATGSIAVVIALAGMGLSSPVQAQEDAQADEVRQTRTTLRPGDMLRISVWPNDDLSGEFQVEESGYAHLPMLGRVQVQGMPLDKLRSRIRQGYAQSMKNPVVTITPVFNVGVLGQVRSPGVYPVTPTNTLLDVVGMAGGFADRAAAERIRLVREGQAIQFNAERALEEGRGVSALKLQSGDRIVVPEETGGITFGSVLTFVQTAATIGFLVDRALD
jgi:polysaccharide export outer membrane protein